MDNSHPKTIKVLYGSVRKKEGIPGIVSIFLMNQTQFVAISHLLVQQPFARRIVIAEVKFAFIINFQNIQVQHSFPSTTCKT